MEIPKICLVFTRAQKFWPNPANTPGMAAGMVVGPYPVTKGDNAFQAMRVSFVYKANPGYNILGSKVGYHEGDTESLIFLFDADGQVHWVYFSAHASAEGNWCRMSNILRDKTGALLAFVSPTSHAMYPRPGTHYRLFGFANDETRDDIRVPVSALLAVAPNSLPRLPNMNQDREIVPKDKTMSKVERFLGVNAVKKQLSKMCK